MNKNYLFLALVLGIVFIAGCTQEQAVGESAVDIVQGVAAQERAAAEAGGWQEDAEGEEAGAEEGEEVGVEEPGVVLDPNLIAYWKFDGDVKEEVRRHAVTILGDAVFAEGRVGDGIVFDGVDDYLELPENALEEVGELSEGTIAFWFKFDGDLLETQTVLPIFYIGVEENAVDNIFIIEIGHFDESSYGAVPVPDPDNTKIYVTWMRDNWEPFLCYDSRNNLEENTWYHFAAVVDETGNTGYLNGVEMEDRHYNFGRASDPYFLDDIQGEERFMLGYGRSSSMLSPEFIYFEGMLDELKIYDKALSADEILGLVGEVEEAEELEVEEESNVTEYLEPAEPGLRLHLEFEGNAKESVKGYYADVRGDPNFSNGKIGQGIVFDGVDDYVNLSQDASNEIAGLNQGTIAVWFKYESLLETQTKMPLLDVVSNENEPNEDGVFIIEIGHQLYSDTGDIPEGTPDPSNKKIYATWHTKNSDSIYLCFDSGFNLEEDEWHHYALVVGENGNTAYLNGEEIDDRYYNFGEASDQSFLEKISTNSEFVLGQTMEYSEYMYFKGLMDDLRIYDYALSAEEIRQLVD